jgi:Ca-activated chloride channel family protein
MSSLEFQNAGLWYLWILLPVIFWLHGFARREQLKDVSDLFGAQLKGRMWQGRIPGSRANGWLCSLAAALVLFAIMRPSWGYKVVDYEKSVAEIVIALDVSDSMMAADISPSRYERARRKILDFVKRAQGERLALVSFSGTASVESPLTEDPSAFLAKLSEIDPSLLPVSGSRIDLALYRSLEVLGYGRKTKASPVEESPGPTQSVEGDGERAKRDSNEVLPTSSAQAILLITDGESDRGSIKTALARVSKAGVRVFVLGVGTTAGAPIPDQAKGTGFRNDSRGSLVTSRLDSDTLKMIAAEGKGVYVNSVSDDGDLMQIYDQGLKAALTDTKGAYAQQRVAREVFQVPLALAFVFLLIAIWRSWGRSAVAGGSLIVILLGLFAASWNARASADDFLNRRDERARRAYQAEDFGAAVAAWKERLAERGAAAEAADYYNLGNALYRAGDMAAAAEAFKQAEEKSSARKEKANQEAAGRIADTLHNLGNSYLRQGRPKEAIDSYEKSLNLRPQDKDTQQNLTYARKVLAQQEQQQQEQQNSKNQQNEQNQKDAKDPKQSSQDPKQSPDVNPSQQAEKNKSQAKDPAVGQQDKGQGKPDQQQTGENQQSGSQNDDKGQNSGDKAGDSQAGKSASGQAQKPGDTAQNGSGTEQSGSGTEQSGSGNSQSGSATGLSKDEVEKALNKISDDATVFRKRRAATDAQEQIEKYGGNPNGGPEW